MLSLLLGISPLCSMPWLRHSLVKPGPKSPEPWSVFTTWQAGIMLKNFLKASHTDWFVMLFSGNAAIYELNFSVKTSTNEFPVLDLGRTKISKNHSCPGAKLLSKVLFWPLTLNFRFLKLREQCKHLLIIFFEISVIPRV